MSLLCWRWHLGRHSVEKRGSFRKGNRMRWVLTVSRVENFLPLMFSHPCLCQLACSFLLVCNGRWATHPELRPLSGKPTVTPLLHMASCKANCNGTIAYGYLLNWEQIEVTFPYCAFTWFVTVSKNLHYWFEQWERALVLSTRGFLVLLLCVIIT